MSLGTMALKDLANNNKLLDFILNYSIFANSYVYCWGHTDTIFAIIISQQRDMTQQESEGDAFSSKYKLLEF